MVEEAAGTDLQVDAVFSKYRLSCNSPTPIVFQQERSCIKHKVDRKTRQHESVLVYLLTEIRLKLKEGTQSTFSSFSVGVTWIVPMCVTITFSPLGN